MIIQVNNTFKEYLANWDYFDYVIFGGYGSSKSYHTALKLVLKSLKEKRRVLVTRAFKNTLQESCFSLLKEIIYTNGLERYFKFTTSPLKIRVKNGSEFLFIGLDDPMKLKSINDIDTVWVEEAADISYKAFNELIGRLRAPRKLHIFLTFNPVSKTSWVYKYYFKDKKLNEETLYEQKRVIVDNTYYLHSVVNDNNFVSLEYKNRLKDLEAHDPELYRIAYLGHFGIIGEKVFSNIYQMDHTEMMEQVAKVSRYGVNNLFDGLDLGFSVSYNALERCAVDRENNYLYIYAEEYNKGLLNSELVGLIKSIYHGKQYKELIVDSARPELIAELTRNGIRAYPSKKGQGSVLDGLQKIRSFKKVFVSSNCPKAYEDLTELAHVQDRDGNFIEDKFNRDPHTIDAIRYGLENYTPPRLKGGGK